MTYITEDGELIEGDSPLELVEALRDGSKFASGQTLDEYMLGFSERYKNFTGHSLDITYAGFIDNLIHYGYLKSV
jgi:hypothetical protein